MNSLSQKTALITGASSGIGAEVAKLLADKGCHVVLVARRKEKLSELADKIIQNAGTASFFECDLSSPIARQSLISSLIKNQLIPEILVNNAGFGWYGHFETMNWQTASELLAVNIEAVCHLTWMILPYMLQKQSGHIINIGSIVGKLPEQGVALYSSSKAFLDTFTTSLYRELRGSGVSISIARLGPVKTEFFDAARRHQNGGNVPAEKFAISTKRAANRIIRLIRNPHKVVYIPWYVAFSPLLEICFSWILDLIGPILLGKKKTSTENLQPLK